MATLVTSGQITIVDTNDARPITAYITASPGMQQVYSQEESQQAWNPDWSQVATQLVLTARVYVGATTAAQEVSGQLTNRQWSLTPKDQGGVGITGTAALVSGNAQLNAVFTGAGAGNTFTVVHNTSGSTLTIKDNIMGTVPQAIVYFEGDYTDPVTGLVSHVIAQISLNQVQTGSNAVYILTRGPTSIEPTTGTTKTVIAVGADLMRAAGVDTTGITYRYWENNGSTQIVNSAPFNTKYGLKTTAAGSATNGVTGDIGVNLPAAGAWSTYNTLVLNELAITDMNIYKIEAKDAVGTIYQTFLTLYDISDPYQVNIVSSAGDKLQNGVGSTVLTPIPFYGQKPVADASGWSYLWTFYDRNGVRGAFIDASRMGTYAPPAGNARNIKTHTTGTSAVITYDGAGQITMAAGDIIKCVDLSGNAFFYEVASVGGATGAWTVTIRAPVTNTSWLSFTSYPAPTANQFASGTNYGKFFVCVGSMGQRTTTGASPSITVTGDEIDAKSKIACDASKPN